MRECVKEERVCEREVCVCVCVCVRGCVCVCVLAFVCEYDPPYCETLLTWVEHEANDLGNM